MSNENLTLWKSVEKTDPKYTKKAKKGQHTFTSIAPMYQVKMATDQWGSYGSNWGIEVDSESFSEREIGETILLNYDAVLFYPKGKLPIHATEKLAYKTQGANGYLKIDEEARKKVVTNALTKGLSMLGFNADIFTGMFDDLDYVNQVGVEKAIEAAENQESEIEKKQTELINYVKDHKEYIEKATSLGELNGVFKTAVRHLSHQQNITALSKIAQQGLVAINNAHEKSKGKFKYD